MTHQSRTSVFILAGIAGAMVILAGVGMVVMQKQLPVVETAVAQEETPVIISEPEPGPVSRVPLPDEVRGIYWTAYTAGSERGDQLLAYMEAYNLNTVVIDAKMDNGMIAFAPNNPELAEFVMSNPAIDDLDGLLHELGEKGIYRMARLPVMRDSTYARMNPDAALKYPSGSLWLDDTGAHWLDPTVPKVTNYALALAHELNDRGFDEIQFDYVRFPSDGALSSIVYPNYDPSHRSKVGAMQDFFSWIGMLRHEGLVISHDIFGMTFETSHDFNIGQRVIDVYPHTDFVSPMVYPSHYADGFNGFANPALHPYAVVYGSLENGKDILETEIGVPHERAQQKIRPWLQDFDIGAVYTAARIEAQIQAARDAGASGWILWNARNVYEPANYSP